MAIQMSPVFTNILLKHRYDQALLVFHGNLDRLPERWAIEQKERLLEELELGIRSGKKFWKIRGEAGVLALCWQGERRSTPFTQERHVGSLLVF
jgi:hypothetical protein